jgi:hypothetical protein
MVRQPLSGKAVANEQKYPHIVELVVADDELDVEVSRRMMDFHRSRKIQARYGRRIIREKAKSIFGGVFLIWRRPARLWNSSTEKFCNPNGEDANAR